MTVGEDMIVMREIGRGACKKSPRMTKLAMHFLVCPPVSEAACRSDVAAERAQIEARAMGPTCGGLYHRVSDALDACDDGDTIWVFPGEYNERLIIRKSVTLCASDAADEEGRGGADGAAVDCSVTIAHAGESTVLSLADGVRIRGIRFVHTGGDTTGRGRDGPRCLEVCDGRLEVEGSSFTSEAGSAVMCVGAGSAALRGCGLAESGRCGLICVHGGKAECEGCELSDNALNGADVQSGGCVELRKCGVRRNRQTGVLVADLRSFVRIDRVAITDNARRGVTAQKSGLFVLENSTVSRNHNVGVIGIGPWEEQAEPLRIVGNTITENRSTGLWLQRGNAHVERNEISGNGDSGVVAFGPTSVVALRDCSLCDNAGTAVSVHSVYRVSVEGCRIGTKSLHLGEEERTAFMLAMHPRLGKQSIARVLDDAVCDEIFSQWRYDEARPNRGVGIELRGTRARLAGNEVANSGGIGLLVGERSFVEVERGSFRGNHGGGVVVRGCAATCVTRGVACAGNQGAGVAVSAGGSWLSLGGDEAAKNVGWGVAVSEEAGPVHVRGAAVSGNGRGGIEVGEGCVAVELSGVEVRRNVGEGLLVHGAVAMHGGCVAPSIGFAGTSVAERGSLVHLQTRPSLPSVAWGGDGDCLGPLVGGLLSAAQAAEQGAGAV